MAFALSAFPMLTALLLVGSLLADAATVTYNFNVTWVPANPDGLYVRPTIGINGQWPLPILRATVGDTVLVVVNNQLGNQSTTLHFHGLYMNGTADMDGPLLVSQCAIVPGQTFTYNFTVNQPGTYWYHSHFKGQYPDGLRAPLIVHDPNSPFEGRFDQEYVLSVSDWYHGQMATLIPNFLNRANPTGAEPIPDAVLLNDTQNVTVAVEPGKTYMFRVVNIGAFAGQYIWFENHTMSIIEVDGIYTEPADADMIYLSAAQRCSFLITMKNDTSTNYAFVSSMDTDLFDVVPPTLNYNVTGWLVYDSANPLPDPATVDTFDPFDDFTLVSYDQKAILGAPDQTVELVVVMKNLDDGANYAFFNNITYTPPKVPTLYTVMSSGADAVNPAIYGEYTQPFVLDQNQVVEIIVNNHDIGKHPFHLHGHNFQAIWRSDEHAGDYDPNTNISFPAIPMRRDTFMIRPGGNIVLRFTADNPGVWLFHCHIEWHVDAGLIATMVEAPLSLQQNLKIPADHIAACEASGTQYSGNAAGNTIDLLDLSGQNTPPGPLPDGFTPRGIVALAFSAASAILGLVVISWYGLAELSPGKKRISQSNADSPPR